MGRHSAYRRLSLLFSSQFYLKSRAITAPRLIDSSYVSHVYAVVSTPLVSLTSPIYRHCYLCPVFESSPVCNLQAPLFLLVYEGHIAD